MVYEDSSSYAQEVIPGSSHQDHPQDECQRMEHQEVGGVFLLVTVYDVSEFFNLIWK